MLFDHYGQPGTDPVTHKWQKILEYVEQVVAACYRADELDDHEEETPDPTGHGFGVTAQNLAAQTCGVCGWGVICDAAKGEKHGAETTKGAEAVVAGEEQRAGRGGVGGSPAGGCGDPGRDGDSNKVNKYQRSPHASPGHEEGETSTGVGGIIDIKVGSNGAETDGDGELKCEKGAAVSRDCAGRSDRLQ